jgi:N-acetylglucosaminyldiphosphoundecaprenol N-acetyl-beta-D-mannosaminyltransferase
MQASQPLSTVSTLRAGPLAPATPVVVSPVLVLGTRLHYLSWERALDCMHAWTQARESRVIMACNVHSLVTARLRPGFRKAIHNADLATADGAPIAWMMRKLGCQGQPRISGPDLMWRYFEQAAPRGESIFLYGSDETTQQRLVERIQHSFPGLKVAGRWCPPFRELTAEEDEAAVQMINASGAQTVWVSLGCPKQELWMTQHHESIQAVQVGVGAAFAYHAGTIQRAPLWMQNAGLEWLHRLASEPQRLWKRYLVTNTLFVWWAAWQLLRART